MAQVHAAVRWLYPREWIVSRTVLLGGLLALLMVAAYARGLYFPGAQLPFEACVAVLGLAVALHRAASRRGVMLHRALDWVVAVYPAGYLLALVSHPVVPAQAVTSGLNAVMILLWYWCVAHVVRGEDVVRMAAQAVFASGIVVAALGCMAAAGVVPLVFGFAQGRVMSTFQYPNALAAWLIVAMAVGIGLIGDCLGRPERRTGAAALWVYGGGLTVQALTLVLTYSRAGWIVFLLVGAVCCGGLPRSSRVTCGAITGWCVALGLLFSRAAMDAFLGHAPIRALLVPTCAGILGAAGSWGVRGARRAWRDQNWAPGVRAVLISLAIAYGGAILGILVVVGHRTAQHAGQGVIGAAVWSRVASIPSGDPSAVQRRQMWGDAWHLIPHRVLTGYGGGGWEALYHGVQHSLYWAAAPHESILQAWLEGGALAAAGVLAIGPAVGWTAWRSRGKGPTGILLWSMGMGALGLWAHALLDFDLSMPSLALLLWGMAGSVRQAAGGPASAPSAARSTVVAGTLVMGGAAAALLFASVRLDDAYRWAAYASAQKSANQYAQAYTADRRAVQLNPLSAPYQTDLARLTLLAAQASGSGGLFELAVSTAQEAARLDPGDITAREMALQALVADGDWSGVLGTGKALLDAFPLEPAAYDAVGGADIDAAKAALATGNRTQAQTLLRNAAVLGDEYTSALVHAGGAPTPTPNLAAADPELLTIAGQADAMLGLPDLAAAALASPASQHSATALGWLAALDTVRGQTVAAQALLAQGKAVIGTPAAYQQALSLVGAAAG